MCGIAGILLRAGAELSPVMLAQFAKSLAHRGPDGAGEFLAPLVGLVHTRLAVIDLATGDQPLFDGALTLIANGEIYNYRALRAALPAAYATQSDCEPPLKYFAQAREDYARDLRGMYAIAIYDAAAAELVLSRDLFGIKPLYFAACATGLAFASEPRALLDAGIVARQVAAGPLRELLDLQFTTGAATVFAGIERVLPGETLTLRAGEVTARRRLAMPASPPPPVNEAQALAALDAVLQEAVDLHQRSDVPYGMFLSGGIDSAAILTMMARLNAAPVLAYTAGFDGGVADERAAAAATAAALGARHQRLHITKAMVWEHLPEIVAVMDDPVADYAIIPSWFLARRARQDVKVILSGEGGDEMFAGYGRYRAAARRLFPKPMRARGIFDGLEVLRESPHRRGGIAKAPLRRPDLSRLQQAQMADIADWLPHDLLLKLDRCLMAHGIEGRTPFVDPSVAAFAFSLPERFLLRGGQGKYLLRRWLEQHCPAARPFARKQGFDVPVGAWIASEGQRLGALVARQPVVAQLARPQDVTRLFAHAAEKRAGFAAWVLLFLALWHRTHILNLPPAGGVFETLRAI